MTLLDEAIPAAGGEWHLCDATAVAQAVADGEVTAVEVLEHQLARIDRLDGELGSFVFLDRDGAYAAASAVDADLQAGRGVGPLAGVPLGVKALEDVTGWPHTLGSHLLAGRVATTTSTQIQRATRAGAVPVGITAAAEMGAASFTATRLYGVCRNPWDTSRTPGGSSGGSAAAVAAALVPLATGSDSAGSLRIPASFSGVVGFKTTSGWVSRGPGPAGASNIRHYGVLSRSVRDTALFLDVVRGVDELDPASVPTAGSLSEAVGQDCSGLRVAFSADLGFAACDPAVAAVVETAVSRAASGLGWLDAGVEVNLPEASLAWEVLVAADFYPTLSQLVPQYGDQMSPYLVQLYEIGSRLDAGLLGRAQERRQELNAALARVFAHTDLLLLPTAPTVPFAAEGPMPTRIADRVVDPLASVALSYPFNLSGHPAISVPAGTLDGLPIGLQIVGRRHDDVRVLRAAAAIEASSPWALHASGYAA